MISLIDNFIQLMLKIWGWASGRSKKQLEKRRIDLEEKSRIAQITGDLHELRRTRAEIEEIDRRISSGDY